MDAYKRAKEAKRLRERQGHPPPPGSRHPDELTAEDIAPAALVVPTMEAEEAARAAEERLPEPYDKRSYRAGYKAGYMAGRRHG